MGMSRLKIFAKTLMVPLNIFPWLLPIWVVISPNLASKKHTFGWLRVFQARTAHNVTDVILLGGPKAQFGLVGSCTLAYDGDPMPICTSPSLYPKYDLSIFGNLPNYDLFLPLGRTGPLLVTAIALTGFFCILNGLDESKFLDAHKLLRKVPVKVFRLFIGVVALLLMVNSMLLTKSSFDMMAEAFNGAIKHDYPDVNLFAKSGGSYPLVLVAVVILCINFTILFGQVLIHQLPN